MPDISKLGDLCDLLEISIEDLLGKTKDSKTIKKVLSASEDIDVNLAEIVNISPVLTPDMAEKLVKKINKTENIHIEQLTALTPSLSNETLNHLAKGIKANSVEELVAIAPFLNRDTLDQVAENITVENIYELSIITCF